MFGLWKHTRHYWVPYAVPSTVKSRTDDTAHSAIIYFEKCFCGKMRTITVEPDKPPVIRESEEA